MQSFNRRSTWAALFLLVLTAVSCTRPEQNIGLEILPEEDQLLLFSSDTTSIVAYTVVEDSLRTDELSRAVLGNYIDPLSGQIRTSIYTQIRLSTNNVDFGDVGNIVVDSLVLAMSYIGDHWGPSTSQTFRVEELTQDLYIDSAYYHLDDLQTASINMIEAGDETQMINYNDPVVINEDSLDAQLRIRLDKSWAEEFLLLSGGETVSNNENWLEHFKGFRISSTSFDENILYLNLLSNQSNLTMYYRDMNGDETDTTSFVWNINDQSARFAAIDRLRGGEFAELAVKDTIESPVSVFVQGLAGSHGNIFFPFIQDYNDSGFVAISKAELIMPIRDAYEDRLPPFALVNAFYFDEEGFLNQIPDQDIFTQNIGGIYDADNHEYRFDVSRYIQNLLNGDIPDNGLGIFGTSTGVTANRVVLNGPLADDVDQSKNMRLILSFSR
jgi:hypothetical protein